MDNNRKTDGHRPTSTSSAAAVVGVTGAVRRREGRLEEEGRVGDDAVLGDGLLDREGGDGDHGDAAVEDLRVAHERRVLAERVEARVARKVVVGPLAGVELRVDGLGLDGDGEG